MDDLKAIIEQTHKSLEGAEHVALVFTNNSERAAKGPQILEALVELREADLTTPRTSFMTVKHLSWNDNKRIELVTEEMVAQSNPQERKTAVIINVPGGKAPVINLNRIPQGPSGPEEE